MYNLLLNQRLTTGGAFTGNYTEVAQNWRRKTRARGGYWQGSFRLTEEDLTWQELVDFYNQSLGHRLQERTMGEQSWEGLLYEFRLVRDGREYRRTLDPEWFHNRVKVLYSYPDADDSHQGNLAYNPAANSFQDDGQDFSDWETAAGDAVYRISVTNDDDTVTWGFLGAAFTTANADDSVYVYTDVERTDAGWNGDDSATPSSYEVSHVTLAGARQDTGWGANTDSSGDYGEMEYVLSTGGATPEAATQLREVELAEFAWPRSRLMGGGSHDFEEGATGAKPAVLEVAVAGYWATLNWQYYATARIAAASDMITTLVGLSEWVTTGIIDTNNLAVKADCDPIPQRLADLLEHTILQGDDSGNIWQGGVYNSREFLYEAAPTTVQYYLRADGALVNKFRYPVIPSLVRAGFLLKDENAPQGGQPPGTSSAWDDPRVAYVEEVEFIAPSTLNYKVQRFEESVATLEQQIRSGAWWNAITQPTG